MSNGPSHSKKHDREHSESCEQTTLSSETDSAWTHSGPFTARANTSFGPISNFIVWRELEVLGGCGQVS